MIRPWITPVLRMITAMGIARLYPHIAASQVSDIRKLDLATEALLANLVVDVGLQSDVLNIKVNC